MSMTQEAVKPIPQAAPPEPVPPSLAIVKSPSPTDDAFRLALEPQNYEACKTMAALVAKAGLFKVRSPEDAVIRIMTGRALGLPMFASLKGIFSTPDGSVGIEAKLKVALAWQRPECEYIRCTERTMTRASYVAKRRGQPEFPLSFTIEEAKAAGLLDRGDTPDKQKMNNWNRWTADMLMARASGRIVDIVFPEACLGLPSAEELYDDRSNELVGEVVTGGVSEKAATPAQPTPRQAAPARDFAADALALKQAIADAKTPVDRKAARAMVAKFVEEAPSELGEEVKRAYNMLIGAAPQAQPASAPTPHKDPYLPPNQRGDSYAGPDDPLS